MKHAYIVSLVLLFTGCGYANLDEGKQAAPDRFKQLGYEVVGYEGFQWGTWIGGCYGGANIWFQLKTIPDNGIRYMAYIQKWCDDGWQIYSLRAIDAIKPQK